MATAIAFSPNPPAPCTSKLSPERRDRLPEDGCQGVRVGLRPEQVVTAGSDGHKVGRQRNGSWYLLIDHLPEYLAADREIRIP